MRGAERLPKYDRHEREGTHTAYKVAEVGDRLYLAFVDGFGRRYYEARRLSEPVVHRFTMSDLENRLFERVVPPLSAAYGLDDFVHCRNELARLINTDLKATGEGTTFDKSFEYAEYFLVGDMLPAFIRAWSEGASEKEITVAADLAWKDLPKLLMQTRDEKAIAASDSMAKAMWLANNMSQVDRWLNLVIDMQEGEFALGIRSLYADFLADQLGEHRTALLRDVLLRKN